jgi:hypothetical protein
MSTPTPRATSELEVPTDDDRVICIENSDDNVLIDDADASKLCQIYKSPWCRRVLNFACVIL